MSSFIYLPKYEIYRSHSVSTKFTISKYNKLANLSPLQTKYFAEWGSDPQITDYSDAIGSKDKNYSFPPYVSIDTKYGQKFDNLFYGFSDIHIIDWLDLTSLTSGINLFRDCSKLTELKIICNSLKTSTIKNAFLGCASLTNLLIIGTIQLDSSLQLYDAPLSQESLLNLVEAIEPVPEGIRYSVLLHKRTIPTDTILTIANSKNIILA